MKLKIKNSSHHPLPTYETQGSSGMDLRAFLKAPVTLRPLERRLIPTGLFIEIPEGYEGQVRPRSGMSIKHGISLVNCVGTIDSDYRGELSIPVINLSEEAFTLNDGDRIAQLVIAKYERVEIEISEDLSQTERGAGGFGSTGKA